MMSKILPWIIMIAIISGIIAYANPHFFPEMKEKVIEKVQNISTLLDNNTKSKAKNGMWNPFKSKEIDTGEKDCREVMGNVFGAAFATPIVDATCSNLCQIEGHSYKQWKCSEQDTLVCVCN